MLCLCQLCVNCEFIIFLLKDDHVYCEIDCSQHLVLPMYLHYRLQLYI